MKNEEQLSAQLQGLRDQFTLRKSSLQDHVGHLELMREEVTETSFDRLNFYWFIEFIVIKIG